MTMSRRVGTGIEFPMRSVGLEPDAAMDRPLLGRRAIVVDEHPMALASVVGYLASAGCDVVSFTRFDDAKHHLMSAALDILITDLRLGAFNGLQLVGRAQSRWPGIKAIVFSGFDDPVLRIETEQMGATFLLKPLTQATLVRAVMNP